MEEPLTLDQHKAVKDFYKNILRFEVIRRRMRELVDHLELSASNIEFNLSNEASFRSRIGELGLLCSDMAKMIGPEPPKPTNVA